MSTPDASSCTTKGEGGSEDDEESLSSNDDSTSGMDPATRQALTDIDGCQKVLDDLLEKASKEILQVESKYSKLRKPFYDQRAAIIERIPKFWVNAILSHPQLCLLVDEEEEDCLQFLKKLEVEEFENLDNGFRIKFIFTKNPFFDNLVLVKEFQFDFQTTATTDTEAKSISTTIKWNKALDFSKNLSQIIENKKKRGLEPKSFFSWFSDNNDPENDDIADIIKDDLWENPLQYYFTPDLKDSDSSDDEESSEEDDSDDSVDYEELDEENAEGNAEVDNRVGNDEGGDEGVEG